MTPNEVELSKLLSQALRHEPWLYELEVDDEGWVSFESVLKALRMQCEEWRTLSRADVERVIALSKGRHEIRGNRIRALFGHSIPGKVQLESARPPTILFHGTSADAVNMIVRGGLKPMARQYVHLSVDVTTAREVGRRKSRTTAIFEIDARGAYECGVAFYIGNDRVWLVNEVPARFLRRGT